jgi:hypothetical protein
LLYIEPSGDYSKIGDGLPAPPRRAQRRPVRVLEEARA